MASGPPLNLNYTPTRAVGRTTAPGYLTSRLISSYIGYMLVMGVLALIIPKFASVFSDLDFQPPLATVMLLQTSRMCLRYYLWAVCLPLPAFWALANISIADKYRRRRLRLAAFLFVAGFLVFTLFALFIPMMYLM
jgi:hypothetical protein